MARFVALAILIAIGAGVYAFLQKQDAQAVQLQLTKVQEELNTYKTRTNQYVSESKTASDNLEACNAKVTEIQTALDTANAALAKKPGRRR
jgi:uncharacterized protein HemX